MGSCSSHADLLVISRAQGGRDRLVQGHLPRLYFVCPSTIHPLTASYRFLYLLSLNGIRDFFFVISWFANDHLDIVGGSLGFWLWAVLEVCVTVVVSRNL